MPNALLHRLATARQQGDCVQTAGLLAQIAQERHPHLQLNSVGHAQLLRDCYRLAFDAYVTSLDSLLQAVTLCFHYAYRLGNAGTPAVTMA